MVGGRSQGTATMTTIEYFGLLRDERVSVRGALTKRQLNAW